MLSQQASIAMWTILISKSWWWLLKPERSTSTLHHNKFTYLDYIFLLLDLCKDFVDPWALHCLFILISDFGLDVEGSVSDLAESILITHPGLSWFTSYVHRYFPWLFNGNLWFLFEWFLFFRRHVFVFFLVCLGRFWWRDWRSMRALFCWRFSYFRGGSCLSGRFSVYFPCVISLEISLFVVTSFRWVYASVCWTSAECRFFRCSWNCDTYFVLYQRFVFVPLIALSDCIHPLCNEGVLYFI